MVGGEGSWRTAKNRNEVSTKVVVMMIGVACVAICHRASVDIRFGHQSRLSGFDLCSSPPPPSHRNNTHRPIEVISMSPLGAISLGLVIGTYNQHRYQT